MCSPVPSSSAGATHRSGAACAPAHRFMCFNKANGKLRWINGSSISPYDTTFSTPTVLPIGGQQQIVFCSGDGGVWSLQPRTGKAIWSYPFGRAGINISPLVTSDGHVYASQDCENTFGTGRGSVVALDGTESGDLTGKELWRKLEIMAGFSSPVMLDERLYVADNSARLFVFDPKTGASSPRKARQQNGRNGCGGSDAVRRRRENLYDDGRRPVVRAEAHASGVQILDKIRLSNEFCDASPIVSHGRIYITTSDAMYCVGNSEHEPQAAPIPPAPKESFSGYQKVASVQVVPFDMVLSPGETGYKFRLFNSKGQE